MRTLSNLTHPPSVVMLSYQCNICLLCTYSLFCACFEHPKVQWYRSWTFFVRDLWRDFGWIYCSNCCRYDFHFSSLQSVKWIEILS